MSHAPSRADILKRIVIELRRAQVEKWSPPARGPVTRLELPPTLPVGDGREISATNELLEEVSKYAVLKMSNDVSLRPQFREQELYELVRRAFGEALLNANLELADDEIVVYLSNEVDEAISRLTGSYDRKLILNVGCHLFKGEAVYPITVGPVIFTNRLEWLQEGVAQRKFSAVTARRIEAHWSGKKLPKRKPSKESAVETSIIDAVGPCPVICSVECYGLSSKMTQEKALLAARIAMTAVSMMWNKPSEGLSWMSLHYDRRAFNRHYVTFGEDGAWGSSSSWSQMPSGHWVDDELVTHLSDYRWLFDQIGDALSNYTKPGVSDDRPALMSTLFLALWWYHEACRETSDQIATTKFAASMDALARGGGGSDILKYIEARLGFKPKQSLMKDGRTSKQVIASIYNAGRSQLIHGSSKNYTYDWSSTRSTAEVVGRLCIVAACDWIASNQASDDVSLLLAG